MIRATAASLGAFILFLIVHLLDFHYLVPIERTHHLLWTASFGFILLIIFLSIFPDEQWFHKKLHINDKLLRCLVYPLLAIILYGFLFLGYLEFYFTAERSITFRMLMLMAKQPQQSITKDLMFQKYDVPGIVNKRFSDLEYGGFINKHDDLYTLTDKGKFTLNIYKFSINFLNLDTGER